MKEKRVRVGNSRGVRPPELLIEQAGLTDGADLEVHGKTSVIVAQKALRGGWADAARALRAHGGDHLLDPPTPTRFDGSEWQW